MQVLAVKTVWRCGVVERYFKNTYLFLLLIEVVDDDSDEEVQGEERPEDDEEDKVEVHVDVHLTNGLLTNLYQKK